MGYPAHVGNSGLGGTAGWPVGGAVAAATATGGDAQPHRASGPPGVDTVGLPLKWAH